MSITTITETTRERERVKCVRQSNNNYEHCRLSMIELSHGQYVQYYLSIVQPYSSCQYELDWVICTCSEGLDENTLVERTHHIQWWLPSRSSLTINWLHSLFNVSKWSQTSRWRHSLYTFLYDVGLRNFRLRNSSSSINNNI
jgi:hypothetical protein